MSVYSYQTIRRQIPEYELQDIYGWVQNIYPPAIHYHVPNWQVNDR
jgi:hypothetical protein